MTAVGRIPLLFLFFQKKSQYHSHIETMTCLYHINVEIFTKDQNIGRTIQIFRQNNSC